MSRITVTSPGFDTNPKSPNFGKRLHGEAYYRAISKEAKETFPEETIIVDTLTGVAKAFHRDKLEELNGMPTEYRRENEGAQKLAEHFLLTLYESNRHANLIALHHAKKVYNPGTDRTFNTFAPELVGSKHDDSWGGRFGATLFIEATGKTVTKGGKEIGREMLHKLYLSPTPRAKFVFLRKKLGEPLVEPIDLTVRGGEGELDVSPLLNAWDTIFDRLGSGPAVISITGAPGSGKTTLALAPHKRLGSVRYFALEPSAVQLVGIPEGWL